MKTTLVSKTSKAAIRFVTSIVRKDKRALPILQQVHCYANGHFKMSATDLDVTATAVCPAVSALDGTRLIPFAALRDASNAKGEIEIETLDAAQIQFRTGANSTVNFPTMDLAEYPAAPEMPASARSVTFAASEFMRALRSVAGAISTDSSRYVLNGVCVDQTAEGLRLVATDGRRLHVAPLNQTAADPATLARIASLESERLTAHAAMDNAAHELAEIEKTSPPKYIQLASVPKFFGDKEIYEKVASEAVKLAESRLRCHKIAADKADEALQAAKVGAQIIIPTKAVKMILSMPLDKTSADMPLVLSSWTIPSGSSFASVTAGDYSITTKLIEGNFPNYRQVIPGNCKREVVLPIADFSAAVKQAATATCARSESVKLNLEKHVLTITGSTPDGAKASASVAVNYHEPALTIAVHPDYLLSAADAAGEFGEQFTAQFIDELSPAVFRNSAGWLAVVMPMRMS
jgi:DNA polymerase III sliding clamp (beta) subunit (PCNA family)